MIQRKKFKLEEVDIDEDENLFEKYNVKIPVICLDDEEICHHFLDMDVFQAYLSQ